MGSAPYYGPDESSYDIFLERTFLAGDFLCGLGYGEYYLHSNIFPKTEGNIHIQAFN